MVERYSCPSGEVASSLQAPSGPAAASEEESLLARRGEQEFRELIDNLGIGVYRVTAEKSGRIIEVNPALARLLGYDSVEELMKIAVVEVYQRPEDRRAFLEKIRRQGSVRDEDLQMQKKDGSPIWVSCSAAAQFDEKGAIQWIDGVIKDVTDSKRTVEEVRRYKDQLRAVLDAVPGCVSWVGSDLKYLGVNQRLADEYHLSPEAFVGRPIGFLRASPEFDQYAREFIEGPDRESSREITSTIDGQPHHHLIFACKYDVNQAAVFVGVDVTERKKIQEQVIVSQKMEAIGALAGGIAHDFGNILSSILGFSRLAMKSLPEDSKAYRNISMAHRAGKRAENLVRQILSFCREEEEERHPVLLRRIVEESLKLLQSSLPPTIEIRQDLRARAGLIMANPTRVQQVIMNLCVNAVYAMRRPSSGDVIEQGVLEIGLDEARFDREAELRTGVLKPGVYLKLAISDTGHGMDRETMARIFEPFFTTKPRGEGVGMGLATVREIVTTHGGAIDVASEAGAGTTFDVHFPRLEGQEEIAGAEQPAVREGHERILFVDDEEPVVDVTVQILEGLGYKVRGTTSSVEALEVFRLSPREYDLVIADQTMAEMLGTTLAQEIMRVRPGFPIILCTGFSHGITPEKARELGIRGFVYKPITEETLDAAIRRVLGEREDAASAPPPPAP